MAPCGRVGARGLRGPGPLLLLFLVALGPALAQPAGAAAAAFPPQGQPQGQPGLGAQPQGQQQQQQQAPQLGPAVGGGVGVGGGRASRVGSSGGGWKLAEEPVCREDVMRVCPKHSWANNLAVLECLQDVREVSGTPGRAGEGKRRRDHRAARPS